MWNLKLGNKINKKLKKHFCILCQLSLDQWDNKYFFWASSGWNKTEDGSATLSCSSSCRHYIQNRLTWMYGSSFNTKERSTNKKSRNNYFFNSCFWFRRQEKSCKTMFRIFILSFECTKKFGCNSIIKRRVQQRSLDNGWKWKEEWVPWRFSFAQFKKHYGSIGCRWQKKIMGPKLRRTWWWGTRCEIVTHSLCVIWLC